MKIVRENINFERGEPRKTLGVKSTLASRMPGDEFEILLDEIFKKDINSHAHIVHGRGGKKFKGDVYYVDLDINGITYYLHLDANTGDMRIDSIEDFNRVKTYSKENIETVEELHKEIKDFYYEHQ